MLPQLHGLKCYKLPIETYSNCMLSQLDGLKTHVSLTMQMQLRTQWLKCYQLPIETYSNCMLSQLVGLKMHVPLTTQRQLRCQ